ncbi:hypothetical protein [Pseudorhodoferax sp.]|uniref:hypothetical protein n=1 Tax=Pseudorhodoferax sp. TaxID=1993553 RepID=UPI002DD6628A|nr:hypothetical protein [Pseudorhodoferax sp.]
MNTSLTTRSTAFGLAAAVTLTLLLGIQHLATAPADASLLMAKAQPAVQQVVIVGKRLAAA